jgi:hypothetical protein
MGHYIHRWSSYDGVDEKARQPREPNLYQRWRWILDYKFPSQIAPNGRTLYILKPDNSSFFFQCWRKTWLESCIPKGSTIRREVVDTSYVFITTIVEASGLIAPEDVSTPPLTVFLDGTIKLSTKEHLLAIAKF